MVYQSEQPPIDIPDLDLFTFLFGRADETPFPPDKVIYQSTDQPERTYTYRQVCNNAIDFAHILVDHSTFQAGQVAAFISPNDIDIGPLLLGIWHAGGTATGLNPNYTVAEMQRQLDDSGASMIITHPSCLKSATSAAALAGIPGRNILVLGNQRHTEPFKHWRDVEPTRAHRTDQRTSRIEVLHQKPAPAFLPYSSGTTGTPKGVILTHKNLCANVLQAAQHYERYLTWAGGPQNTISGVSPAPYYNSTTGEGGDKLLCALPVYHSYGLMFGLLLPLWMGTTCCISMRLQTQQFAGNIKTFQITKIFVVPPILIWLLNDKDLLSAELGKDWYKSVRMCMSAAAPLMPELSSRAWQSLGWRVIQGYGLSETSPAIFLQDLGDWEERASCVGKLVCGVEAKLVKLDDPRKEVMEGADGELVVRGPNVFMGYLNREAETEECLSQDGWFRTGDIGHFRDGQVLEITDRLKDMIKYHGFQVAPVELEATIFGCEVIKDVAVVGIECPTAGTEVPRAYCVHRDGLSDVRDADTDMVLGWVQDRLAKHKLIRGGVRWVAEIPKSPTDLRSCQVAIDVAMKPRGGYLSDVRGPDIAGTLRKTYS